MEAFALGNGPVREKSGSFKTGEGNLAEFHGGSGKCGFREHEGQQLILIREKLVDTLDSLPVISSIPFLRRLLGNTAINTTRTEMLVMITATIVSDETPLQRLVRGYQQAVDSLIEFEQNADTKTRLRRFKHNGDLDRWFLE